jgi:hypothetical protein
MPVPEELGGFGMLLADVNRKQCRLAYYAHTTALAVDIHLYWLGVAADLWRAGNTSLEWLLRAAVAGKVFAAGHGFAAVDHQGRAHRRSCMPLCPAKRQALRSKKPGMCSACAPRAVMTPCSTGCFGGSLYRSRDAGGSCRHRPFRVGHLRLGGIRLCSRV